jgi:hypothetical protein
MAGHTNLIKEAMESLDDGGDLLRQIAGVHDEGLFSCEQRKNRCNGPFSGGLVDGGSAGGAMAALGTDAQSGPTMSCRRCRRETLQVRSASRSNSNRLVKLMVVWVGAQRCMYSRNSRTQE